MNWGRSRELKINHVRELWSHVAINAVHSRHIPDCLVEALSLEPLLNSTHGIVGG